MPPARETVHLTDRSAQGAPLASVTTAVTPRGEAAEGATDGSRAMVEVSTSAVSKDVTWPSVPRIAATTVKSPVGGLVLGGSTSTALPPDPVVPVVSNRTALPCSTVNRTVRPATGAPCAVTTRALTPSGEDGLGSPVCTVTLVVSAAPSALTE